MATEKDNANAVMYRRCSDALHLDVVSFFKMLLRVETFALVLVTLPLNNKLQTSVTPRYARLTQSVWLLVTVQELLSIPNYVKLLAVMPIF